ncbi:MAG TPA: ABC transporter ATP-binding protein [Bacteroidales bacterium]|nr:ABC transporter ATP-binding protein [Bacteroidales bacterium]
MDYAIKLDNVTVSYLQSRNGVTSVKEFLLKASFIKIFKKHQVLHDFNLEISKGESIAFLGPNGCGKSTLLRTIAGIVVPDKGTVDVRIPVSPLLSLGAGVELELTGYDNIRIALVLSGNYHRKTRREMIDRIAEFAELSREQLKKPAKMFSTGMLARLTFSSLMVNQPELLMIDEVLAVGDWGFQMKCKKRIHEIIDNGATLLFVSHNPKEAIELCKRGICIIEGKKIFDGNIDEAADIYNKLF